MRWSNLLRLPVRFLLPQSKLTVPLFFVVGCASFARGAPHIFMGDTQH